LKRDATVPVTATMPLKTSPQLKPLEKIKRGYSSGESSGTLSDDDSVHAAKNKAPFDNCDLTDRSIHGVLGLSDLRQMNVTDGALAKTMVRLEVRCFVFVLVMLQPTQQTGYYILFFNHSLLIPRHRLVSQLKRFMRVYTMVRFLDQVYRVWFV
jgi:hypothetical protein